MMGLGEELTLTECKAMIREGDLDNDGMIDFRGENYRTPLLSTTDFISEFICLIKSGSKLWASSPPTVSLITTVYTSYLFPLFVEFPSSTFNPQPP